MKFTLQNQLPYARVLSATLMLLCCNLVWSQTPSTYILTTNSTSSLVLDLNTNNVDMTTGTTSIVASGDNTVSAVTNIGFNFSYAGTTYTQFSSGANGIIRLGATVIGGATYAIGQASQALIAPFAGDLEVKTVGKVHYKLVGTAPNRTLVIEFLNMGIDYTGTYTTPGDGTYQLRLYETTNVIEFVYGDMFRNSSATNSTAATFNVGISTGTAATDIVSINTATGAVSNTLFVNAYTLSANIPVLHSTTNGVRKAYIFTPPPAMSYSSATVLPITSATGQGKTNAHVVALKVSTLGVTSPLSLTSIDLNTTGTSSLSDISNVKIFYTGNSSAFAATNQFGTTVATAAANHTVTGTRVLATGDNYFWLTYDVSPTATINNAIDGEVTSFSIGVTPYTPTVTAPAGNRLILGPLSGNFNVGVGQTYTTLTQAITEINDRGVFGPVQLSLTDAAYNAATGELFPITIGAVTGASAINKLTIQPSASATPLISAKVNSAMFILNGAKYVTFEGRQGGNGLSKTLTIQNDSANTLASAFVLQNDASYNNIQHAIIKSSGTTATTGVINFGTGVTTGNDSNLIDFCDIGDANGFPSTLIQSLGSTDIIAKYNDYNTVSNCNMFNFWNAGAEANAFKISNGNNYWTIRGNSVYQTSVTPKTTNSGYYSFNFQNSDNYNALNGSIITDNYIGGSAPMCGGTPWLQGSSAGTLVSYFKMGNLVMSNVSRNVFSNINIVTTSTTTTGGGTFNAVQYINGMLNIDSNIIGSMVDTSSVQLTTGSGGVALLISSTASNTAGTYSIVANKIGGIKVNGGGAISNNLTAINITSAGTNMRFNLLNNIIGNDSIDNILAMPSTSATVQVIRGINNTSTATLYVANNVIKNLTNQYAGTGAGGIFGFSSSAGTDTVINNTFHTFKGNPAASSVNGIALTGGTSHNIIKNKLYNFNAGSGSAFGILMSGSTANTVYNNIIGDLKAPLANLTNAVIGINITGGTTNNLYYNTVNINASSTGTNFGTSAISVNATPTTINLRNNIFVNTSTGNGTGLTVAYRRSSTVLTNYAVTSNNNLFYAGVGNDTNVIYTDGTNKDQTIGAFKVRMATRDAASVTENVTFASTNGVDANYLAINNTIATQVESKAVNITTPAITSDFAGTIRQGNAGYLSQTNGGGTAPDLGAFEFDGMPASAPSVTNITLTPSVQCVASAHTVKAVVKPQTGTLGLVELQYAYNGVAQTPITMTVFSGDTFTAVIPAATPSTASVTWAISATNSANLNQLLAGNTYQDEPLVGTNVFVSASANPLCPGSSAVLSGGISKPNQQIAVGLGATTNNLYVSPFYSNWSNTHNQYLVRASELVAAGLAAGNITSLAVDINAGTTLLYELSIKMANTTANDVATFVSPTFTNVYFAATYTPVIGANVLTFSTPFNWDGVSNIVIELCQGNPGSTATVNSTVVADNTSYVSTIHTHRTASTAGSVICGDNTTNLTTYSTRPKFTFTGAKRIPLSTASWNDGFGVVGTNDTLILNNVTTSKTYTITATDTNGCSAIGAPYALNVISSTLTGTYTVGASGTYPTITQAVAAYNNACTVNGSVIFELIDPAYSSTTGETFPIVLNAKAGASPTQTLTIRPATGNTVVMWDTVAGPLFRLNGAKYVTIDGRAGGIGTTQALTIQNDSIAGSAMLLINDASYNTVKYVTLRGASNAATNGVINFGTGITTGNDSNLIEYCDIRDASTTPASLIQSLGSIDVVAKYNDYNTISNCNLYNFWHPSAEGNAFKISNGNNYWTITGNSVYQTASRAGSTGFYTFNLQNSGNLNALNGLTITNNYIGGSAPMCGGSPWIQTSSAANQNSYFNLGNLAMSNFKHNTIANYNFTTTSTSAGGAGVWNLVQYINGMLNIDSNLVGSLTDTASIRITCGNGGAVLPISLVGNTAGTYSVTGNKFGGIYINGNTNSNSISCIFATTAAATVTYNIERNQIGVQPIKTVAAGTTTGQSVLGIYNNNSAANYNIKNNTIRNLYNFYTGTGTATVATPGQTVGIASTNGNNVITGNSVANLVNATAQVGTGGLASVLGIACTSTTANMEIAQNQVYALSNINQTANVNVVGILYSGGAGWQTVARNNVHSFSTASTSATSSQVGILAGGGTARLQNNMVRLGIDSAGVSQTVAPVITGIAIAGGNIRAFFNTVYIGATGVSGAGNSFALNRTSSGNDSIYNNILVNERTGGSGNHYSIGLSNNTNLRANYNLYYNTNIATLGLFNGTTQAAIGNWKIASAVDGSSNSGNPSFVNAIGDATTVNLHITGTTPVEGAGLPIVSITDDFDGDTRSGLSPTDIGADAGNFTLSDIFPPSISYTAITKDTVGVSLTLSGFATITDPSGVAVGASLPRIYYKKKSDNDAYLGNTMNDNGWKFVTATNSSSPFSFVINYNIINGGSIVLGDTIQYFVVAQDSLGSIGANPAGGFSAAAINSITTSPTNPAFYIIKPAPLAGLYNVGTGQTAPNYPTLTAAITSLNDVGVRGAVTFNLLDATYSTSETFPIVVNQAEGISSTNTVTIKPATGVNSTITGSSTSSIIILNGADYITIDGSNNGTSSRNLTIENVNTGTTQAVIWVQNTSQPNGATNNTIKNTVVKGNARATTLVGVGVGNATISATSLGDGNHNNTVHNCDISLTQYGVYNMGASLANKNNGTVITGNNLTIHGKAGVYAGFNNNINISGNRIADVLNANTAYGIALGTVTGNTLLPAGNDVSNANVSNNIIDSICSSGTWTAAGILLINSPSAGTNNIVNNMISRLHGTGTANDFTVGIYVGGGALNTTNVQFNTVHLNGTLAGSSRVFALGIDGNNSVMNIRNNILMNVMTGSTQNTYAIGINATSFTNLIESFNTYTSTGTTSQFAVTGGLIGTGGTNLATLADWQTTTGKGFASNVNTVSFVAANDLHLTFPSIGNPVLTATPIAGITTDIDGFARSVSFPYRGADENIIPVPVKLISFTANTGGKHVDLAWTTASESNNKGFDIERSIDGVNFEKVTFVKGAVNSNRVVNYTLTDADAFAKAGVAVLYYRLKQIDLNGATALSNVVMVSIKTVATSTNVTVYPNPFNNKVEISMFANQEEAAEITIVDISGRLVTKQTKTLVTGSNTIEVSQLDNLGKGIYFITITNAGNTITQKLVKN